MILIIPNLKKMIKLEKSSKKFNKENKPVYENYQKKKIEFNYDSLSDKNNLKIKNFKKRNLLNKTIENFENDNLMYDKKWNSFIRKYFLILEKKVIILSKNIIFIQEMNVMLKF